MNRKDKIFLQCLNSSAIFCFKIAVFSLSLGTFLSSKRQYSSFSKYSLEELRRTIGGPRHAYNANVIVKISNGDKRSFLFDFHDKHVCGKQWHPQLFMLLF